ncbi:paired immunoglobulin-like type 2 receptor alpha [Scyliorhinus torazame]|uniref:paired immunoglobulin-like type 2 receptor alpha n=1 Tax=Scyliorhinus torazame TaxID=75743 RepID=UPI003B5CEB97
MTVPSGSAAALLCSFNWTGRLPEVRQVAWHKSTEGTPSLVVHTRDLFQENKNQDKEFAGRTYLAASWFEKRDASLNLSNISINDTGLYQCQISTERPKASGVCADIKLTVTPGMINGNDFRVTQPRSLEGFVGSSVDIPCSFTYPESFNPTKIDICWRRHGFHGRFIFNVSKPYTHPDYRGRIEFLGFPYRDRTGTIRINHLKQSDQNRYFCCVETTGDYSEKWQSLVGTELIVGARRPPSTTAQLISSVTAASSRDGAARGETLEPGEILIIRSSFALAILAIVWLIGIYLMKTQQVTDSPDQRVREETQRETSGSK